MKIKKFINNQFCNILIILILTVIILVLMTACTTSKKKPEQVVVTEYVEFIIYQPPRPTGLKFERIQLHVITRDNFERKATEISKKTGSEFVVFAITPKDYEKLSYNLSDLYRYISEQINIIEYYEQSTVPTDTAVTNP